MNTHVEAARQRLAAIEQEAEKLRLFIAAWEGVADILAGDHVSPASDAKPVDNLAVLSREENATRTRAVNPPTEEIVAAAIAALRERGHPMTRRALHQELWRRGVEVRGRDPVKTLGTILWRAGDRIIQLDGFGYWPKHLPYSRADYPGIPTTHGPQPPLPYRDPLSRS